MYVQYLLEIISNIPPIVGWCENRHLPTPTSKQTSWNSGRFLSPTNTVYYCIYCEKRGAWFCLVLWVEIGTTNSKQSIKQPPDFTFKHATYGEDWTWPFHHWVCTVKSFGPIAWLVSAKMGYCTPFHPLAEKLRLSLSKLKKKTRELNVPSFLNKHIKKSYKHIHYWLLFAHPVLPFNIPLKIPGQCPNPIIHGTCTSTSDCFIQHHPSSVIPILLLNIPIKTAPN